MGLPELLQGRQIHVIVVIVRHEERVDWGRTSQSDCGRIVPAGTDDSIWLRRVLDRSHQDGLVKSPGLAN